MIQTMSPTRWSLTDLLADPYEETLEAMLRDLETMVGQFEAAREHLTDDVPQSDFLEILRLNEAIADLTHRMGAYAQLWFYSDTKDPLARNLRDRVDKVLTDVDNRTLFFGLWLKDVSDDAFERLTPPGSEYRYLVESARKFKPYALSEPEEQVINLKDTDGVEALVGVYDMITNAFEFQLEVDGERKTVTRDELGAYYRHSSPELRAAAFQELYRVYEANSAVLTQIYNHRVRDWHSEMITLRRFPTPIASRNFSNDIPDDVVEALLDVCRRNNAVYQRYFRLKAHWLGVDKLRRYDIYAPLSRSDKTYDYGYAVGLVLETFNRFHPQVGALAQRVFDTNHIDSEVRPGKRGGAFCYTATPQLAPWVHVNYTGKAADIATLAHELGHAIHNQLAADHSILTYHPSLPLAETASVFAEMMLTDRLLREEPDPGVRRDLLAAAVDDAYATVQRQAYISIFERRAHDLINDGASVDEVRAFCMANQYEQFGDSLHISDEFQWEWITIPHIYHTPFYTYAYSFGQLLVLSLYQQYRLEGDSFIPRYLKILSYGGAEEPMRVLREAGLEPASTEFWQGGYDVIAGMIDELEGL